MGLAIQAISWITEIGIGIAKKSYLNLYAYLIFLAINISGIFLLVPILGLMGVAISVFTGYLFKAFTASYFAQKVHFINWQYYHVLPLIVITSIIGLSSAFCLLLYGSLCFYTVLTAGIIIIALLGWTSLFSIHERKLIKAYIFAKVGRITNFD